MAPIDHDWCPHKKRTFRHRELQTEDHVEIQVRKWQLQAIFFIGNQPCQHLDLRAPASRITKTLLMFKSPIWVACYDNLSKLWLTEDFAIDISPGNIVKEFDELRWRV